MRTTHLLALSCLATACTPGEAKPIDVAKAVCPPRDLFTHAVCVCDDFTQVGELHVLPGPAGVGSVGVNGFTELVSDADVLGSWFARAGFSAVGVSIGDTLVTPSDVTIVGDASIHDAVIGGNLLSVGTLAINGSLRLAGEAEIVGDSSITARSPYAAPAGPPCGCDEETFYDVTTAVAAARQATGGESAWQYVGQHEIRLSTGSYYVTSAELVGDTTIVIE